MSSVARRAAGSGAGRIPSARWPPAWASSSRVR